MKAIVWTKYGSPDGLQLKEVEKPTPKEDEVLLKNNATTVIAGDCELRRFKFPFFYWLPLRLLIGIFKPTRITILGQELAGEVEAMGKDVTRFKTGDQVIAATLLRLSSYAEYVCLPDTYPQPKPANLTYAEAATIPTGGIYGLHLLRQADIHSGQTLLLIGAGGSIGTYAIQLAKSFGVEVTGVDRPGKLDMLRSIGADHVIDYTQDDFTKSGKTYDAIIDVIGKSSFSGCVRSLNQNGRYVLGNPGLSSMLRGQWTTMTTGKKVIYGSANHNTEDYAILTEMIMAGKIKPVIDRCYPLEKTAEAHRYVETGQKKGNVVITVDHNH